jgi:hypothetical protein
VAAPKWLLEPKKAQRDPRAGTAHGLAVSYSAVQESLSHQSFEFGCVARALFPAFVVLSLCDLSRN